MDSAEGKTTIKDAQEIVKCAEQMQNRVMEGDSRQDYQRTFRKDIEEKTDFITKE